MKLWHSFFIQWANAANEQEAAAYHEPPKLKKNAVVFPVCLIRLVITLTYIIQFASEERAPHHQGGHQVNPPPFQDHNGSGDLTKTGGTC